MPSRPSRHLRSLPRNEQGGQVLEYALIVGLIVLVSITVISLVGTKVFSRYDSINQAMDANP
jgi:Flp pilus assembly pilin Flp